MAKKTVATLKDKTAKKVVKVIKPLKSAKSGAFTFREEIVPEDEVKEFFKS